MVNIHIPPLRSRKEDIRPLVDHFLKTHEQRLGHKVFARDALDALLRYDFPGNIRELQNIIERAMVLARSEVIGIEDLPASVASRIPPQAASLSEAASLPRAVETLERSMIVDALAGSNGVQVKAAEKLGISERNLRYKIKKLGIS